MQFSGIVEFSEGTNVTLGDRDSGILLPGVSVWHVIGYRDEAGGHTSGSCVGIDVFIFLSW